MSGWSNYISYIHKMIGNRFFFSPNRHEIQDRPDSKASNYPINHTCPLGLWPPLLVQASRDGG